MVALGNFLFRFRTTLSPFLPLLLLLPGATVLPDPFVAALIGLAVALLGQIVRGTTIGLEYIVRGGRDHRVYADTLVTEGLFRHTRNPMYVGKFLMVLGAAIASNHWPSLLAFTGVYTLMYEAVTLAEEDYLRTKFGPAFDKYCRHVPRWWPKLSGLKETFQTTRFNWKRVLIKGYAEPLGWTLPIVLIGLWNIHKATGLAERPVAVAVLWTVLGVVAVISATLGILKKTRTLALAEG
ncbi:MAG TPA: isoprenylcysteine carboxylmethyltransferase family protein [Gammaproteobacteria bacterium]